ncbi:MAG: phosphoribosylglycinamide formyltransferase [Candidatus Omnitrophica bacterium]|nr:Phosphoribosylglycinamide formyltransferase [bacterium]NUN97973.1 phosphoribosylglycinamide formyltransferase [Candidatus Omnitrophota bacterium]
MRTEPIRLAVFFSGGGSTLQNLLDHIASGSLNARVEWTLSSRVDAVGIEKSRRAGIPCLVLPRKEFTSHEEFSQAINLHLERHPVDLIVLAGFMCLYRFPPDYNGRVLNIHPALIPSFCGKGMYGHHVHEAVIESGVKLTGATVHFADNEYDRGPIILQEALPVLDEDTPETLAERVQALERELYPKAIRLFAEGRLRVEGRRVRILPEEGS